MALPLLNETPRYEFVIPSTGKKLKFRPYLVKEEKVLMMASESKDPKQMMSAILDTVVSCAVDTINPNSLTTFDLEYLFIKLRAKSVGETSTLSVNCDNCSHKTKYSLNLEEIECKQTKPNNKIKINDKITVEMKYPGYKDIEISEDQNELGFSLLASSIAAVYTENERIDVSEEPKENVRAFLESMTRTQFETITTFLQDMPVVKAHVKFNCEKCQTLNEFDVKGIQSFF
jgi:hypothetical protein